MDVCIRTVDKTSGRMCTIDLIKNTQGTHVGYNEMWVKYVLPTGVFASFMRSLCADIIERGLAARNTSQDEVDDEIRVSLIRGDVVVLRSDVDASLDELCTCVLDYIDFFAVSSSTDEIITP